MKEKGITYLFPAKIREILEKTGFNLEEHFMKSGFGLMLR